MISKRTLDRKNYFPKLPPLQLTSAYSTFIRNNNSSAVTRFENKMGVAADKTLTKKPKRIPTPFSCRFLE